MSGPWLPGQGVVSLSISRTGDIDPYSVSWGFRPVGGLLTSDLDAIGAAIGVAAKPNLSLVDTLTNVRFTYLVTAGADNLVHDLPSSVVGTLSSAICPQNVAFLLQKRAGSGGRHGRGRCYWPTVPEADVNEIGVVAPGAITRLTTMCNAFLAAMRTLTPASTDMTILPAVSGADRPVVVFKPDTVIATQRRRLRR